MDQSRRWTASVDRHVHRVEDQLRPEVVRHGPAYDLSGVGVEHEGEVEPPLPGPDVGYVRNPQPIRSFGSEVALHQVLIDPFPKRLGRDIQISGYLRHRKALL